MYELMISTAYIWQTVKLHIDRGDIVHGTRMLLPMLYNIVSTVTVLPFVG